MSRRYNWFGIVHDINDAQAELAKKSMKKTTIDIYFRNEEDHVVYTAALQLGGKEFKIEEAHIPLWGNGFQVAHDAHISVLGLEAKADATVDWLDADGIDVKVRKYYKNARE